MILVVELQFTQLQKLRILRENLCLPEGCLYQLS